MRFMVMIFSVLAISLPAHSQPLTDQGIQQWAGSYQDLMAWADTNAVEPDVEPGPHMFRRSMEYMQPRPEFPAISSLLAGHGYDDPMAWADLSDRIFDAYQSLHVDQANASMAAAQPQIQQALQSLLENPNLTQAQKDEIMKSVGQVPAAVAQPPTNIDPADLAAVERNRPVIDAAIGMNAVGGQ